MPTNYPGILDSYTTKTDLTETIYAAHVNNMQDAIVAIETELATNPKGANASVKARLEWIESQLGAGGAANKVLGIQFPQEVTYGPSVWPTPASYRKYAHPITLTAEFYLRNAQINFYQSGFNYEVKIIIYNLNTPANAPILAQTPLMSGTAADATANFTGYPILITAGVYMLVWYMGAMHASAKPRANDYYQAANSLGKYKAGSAGDFASPGNENFTTGWAEISPIPCVTLRGEITTGILW